MDLLIVLAQAADATEGMPTWLKVVLGPLGLTIALAYYAYRTETVRLPKLVTLLEKEQASHQETRDDCDKKKEEIRQAYLAREKVLRRNGDRAKSRHGREKTRRIFWQTKAIDIAKRNDEEEPKMPTEISATSYQHQPLPRDPEPDSSLDEDDDLPPAPDL